MATTKSAPKTAEPGTAGPDPKDSEPVARFSTKRARRTVEVDGKFYELRTLGDYGIGAQQRLNRDGREFGQLWNATDDLTEDQVKRLKFLLDRIFDGDDKVAALLDAPKTVRRALNDEDRAELVLDFCYAPLRKLMVGMAAAEVEQDNAETQDEARVSESISTS